MTIARTPGRAAGRAQVVAEDARMRMRALQHRAMQHVGAIQIGDVLCAAADLLVASSCGADWPTAVPGGSLMRGSTGGDHRAPRSSTASTMLV